MDNPYRREFPPAARAKIKAKKILALRDLEQSKQNLRGGPELEAALRRCILQVFLSFAEEALELGRQGVWSIDQVEAESREFLRRTTLEVEAENGFDRSGHQLPTMISNWNGAILSEVQRKFEKSPEWKEFRDGLLEVAELQACRAMSGSSAETVETASATDMDRPQGTAANIGVEQATVPNLAEAAARPADTERTAQPDAADFVAGQGARPLLNAVLIDRWMFDEGYDNIELAQRLNVSVRAVRSMRRNEKYHGRGAVQKLATLMSRDVSDLYLS